MRTLRREPAPAWAPCAESEDAAENSQGRVLGHSVKSDSSLPEATLHLGLSLS